MDGHGPLVADRPRLNAELRKVETAPAVAPQSTPTDLVRRLLTPAQYWKYRLIPGRLYGWARSMRRRSRGESELRLLSGLVDPHRTAVDIGANKGTYTWPLSRLCRHVYAYEPNPAMRWMLSRCVSANVTIFPRALSDHAGEAVLRIPARGGRYSNNVGTLRQAFDHLPCELVPVATSRLDDDGLVDVGFIKIDVEGHEQEVLRGAREIIARDRPVLLIEIIAEHTDRPVDDTIDFVEHLGYRAHVAQGTQLLEWAELRDRRGKRSIVGEPNAAIRNYIFLPTGHSAVRAA